jgi:non-ribosomal peptide synthetase component F
MTATLQDRLAALSPRQREQLAATLRRRRASTPDALAHVIPRRACRTTAPLSPAQRRLWFLHQLEPRSAAYHVTWASRLSGPLDVEALSKAFDALTARHELLRTRFVVADGTPRQEILPPRPMPLPVLDLRRDGPDPERAARARMREAIAEPFDLTAGYLLRVRLYRLAEAEHVLLVVGPHIVIDGWSAEILLREFGACYAAAVRGVTADLPAIDVQYGDVAAWEDLHDADGQLAYWLQQLRPPPPPLRFGATGCTEPAGTGGALTVAVAGEVREPLLARIRQDGITMFVATLAAYHLALRCHASQDDLIVGAPVARRSRPETRHLVGLFSNTLPLRLRAFASDTLRAAIQRTHDTVLDGFAHQDVSMERIVEALRPDRRAGASPLFQTIFTLERGRDAGQALPGVAMTPFPLDARPAQFDLVMHATDAPERLDLTLEYCAARFDGAAVRSIAASVERVLRVYASGDDPSLAALDSLLRVANGRARADALCGHAAVSGRPDMTRMKRRTVRVVTDSPRLSQLEHP